MSIILGQLANFYKWSKDTIAINLSKPSIEEIEKTTSHIKRLGNEAKISVKNIRQKLKKTFTDEKELQKLVDNANKEIDQLVNNKITEIKLEK